VCLKNITVWGKAIFRELEIRRLSYVGGDFLFSPAGCTIDSVTAVDAEGNEATAAADIYAYRCFYTNDDGTTATTNSFMEDDQALCQTFNIKAGVYENVANRYYWRRVVAVGDGYIDLSASDYDDSAANDTPQKGDVLACVGNRTNTERQSLIKISTEGDTAPAIECYHGVWNYHLGRWTDTAGAAHNNRTALISPAAVELSSSYFRWTTDSESVPQIVFRGDWEEGTPYYYYEEVTWDDCTWLCVTDGTDAVYSEPAVGNDDWKLMSGTPTRGREMTVWQKINGELVAYDGLMSARETQEFTFLITDNKGGDHTSEFTLWSVTRDSGDEATDAVWNAGHTNIGGNTLSLTFSDLGIDGITSYLVTFHVTATDEATSETATQDMTYSN